MVECEYEVCWNGATWRQDRVIVPCPEPTPETEIVYKPTQMYLGGRPTQVAILACLEKGSFVAKEIAKATGFSLSSVHRNLVVLVRNGEITVTRCRGGAKEASRWGTVVYRLAQQLEAA